MYELIRKCWSAGKQAEASSSPARASCAGCMWVSQQCSPAAFHVPQQRCMNNKIPGLAQAHTYATAVVRLHMKRLEPNSTPGQSPCSGLSVRLCWHDTGASPGYHSISPLKSIFSRTAFVQKRWKQLFPWAAPSHPNTSCTSRASPSLSPHSA